jgi:hypothetical protein
MGVGLLSKHAPSNLRVTVPLIDHHISTMTSSTSPSQKKRQKADTIKRTRFLHVIDNRADNVIIKDDCERENASEF